MTDRRKQMQQLDKLERQIEKRFGKRFVDVIRTRYWASFATLDVLSKRLGCSTDELCALIDRHSWELQHPPALDLQNRLVTGAVELTSRDPKTVTVENFIADPSGRPAASVTRVALRADGHELSIRFDCEEPDMHGLRVNAGGDPVENNPFNIAVWEANFGWWEGNFQWMTRRVKEMGEARFLELARAVPPRPYSVFEDDCVVIFLTPVHIGDDKTYLDITRLEENPFELAERLSPPAPSRIYLTGTFYYIAVNPAGVLLDGYYDPWEGGFFWASWDSEARVVAERKARSWLVRVAVPYRSLEPLMDNNAVWGIDLYRRRPARDGQPAEYSRCERTVLFRYDGDSLAPKIWRPTFEDIDRRHNRHEWTSAQVPQVQEMTHRPLPTASAKKIHPPPNNFPSPEDWEKAEAIERFFDERTGSPARARTRVKALHDGERLFVRFDCYDDSTEPLRIVTEEDERALYGDSAAADFLDRREHFGIGWGDFVEVIFAPQLDETDCFHAGYYDILVNAEGRLLQRYYDCFGMWSLRKEDEWRSEARARVEVERGKWVVELTIPLGSIHGIRKARRAWRVNFLRKRDAKDDSPWRELSAWSPTYGRTRDIARFGTLRIEEADFHSITDGDAPKVYSVRREHEFKGAPRLRERDCLRGVCFDGKSIRAVGGLGTILKREGTGAWREQDSASKYILERVCFADEKHGWCVGGWVRPPDCAIVGGMGIILATSDGGESWRTQWEGKGGWLYDVCFVSPTTGWAVGEYGAVLKTTDGGRTWIHLTNTGTRNCLYSVCFVDEQHGWVVGERETILHTDDGGATWRRQTVPPLPRPFYAWECFRGVHFADGKRGCIVGGHCTILHTDDGGRNWRLIEPPFSREVREIFDLNDVHISPDGTGCIVGEIGSVVLITNDGGLSWEAVETGFGGALHAVCLADSRRGYAVGERGTCLETNDGGRNWSVSRTAKRKPCWMYVTPHLHHLNALAGMVASMADDYDFACAFPSRTVKPWAVFADSNEREAFSACWSIGVKAVRVWRDFAGGRRRSPDRLHHHYQMKRGLEPLARRLTAAIRALRPEAVIAEFPIMDEGYWAGEPAFVARAVTLAFCAAGESGRFDELEEIGLKPHQPQKLYYTPRWFNELYGVHPTTHRITPKDGFSRTLGMTYSEAVFRCRCCWTGLLDRGKFRMPPPEKRRAPLTPVSLHLKFDRSR